MNIYIFFFILSSDHCNPNEQIPRILIFLEFNLIYKYITIIVDDNAEDHDNMQFNLNIGKKNY